MSVRREARVNPATGRKRQFWIVDVDLELPDGKRKRVRKVSPVQTRRGALEYERELRQSILSGSHRQKEDKPLLFGEFAREFMKTHAAAHNKPSEQTAKESMLRLHLLPNYETTRLDKIDELSVAKFVSRQMETGLNPKTINNQLILLRSILGKAYEWKKLKSVPKIKKLPVPPPKTDFLDYQESTRLVEAAAGDAEWQSAIIVALNTGLRLGELIGLKWEDCDLKARKLTVRRTVWQGHVGTPKSGRNRTIPLNHRAIGALQGHRHLRGPWVWSFPDGAPHNKDTFKLALAKARKFAGLRHFEWHTLRHTFASHLAMKGAPLRVVQELLGHASIQMTMRYAHLSPEIGISAVDSLVDDEVAERQHDGNRNSEGAPIQKQKSPDSTVRADVALVAGAGFEPTIFGL